MALSTPTLLAATPGRTAAGTLASVASASVSPSSDALLIACVGHIAGVSNTLSSLSTTLSNVGSWTIAAQFNGLVGGAGAFHTAAIAWAKITGAPGTGTVTANLTGGTGYTGECAVLEIASGYHATPTGVTGTNSASANTDFIVTASGSPASTSTMIGFLNSLVSGNTDNAFTPDASYTELEEGFQYYATIGASFEWQVVYDANSADDTCTFPRPSTGTCSAALVEFVESATDYMAPRIVVRGQAVNRSSRW